ncbi:MAG: hypothetical protein QXT45_01640 [Candidatus Bilamarchaeaceae archaeon]
MDRRIFCGVFLLICIALLAGVGWGVECSIRAYRAACANCPFDTNGKMDQTCYENYKRSGISCISSTYPIMSGKYAAGQCPKVDKCAEGLRACLAEMSSGNDKQDCNDEDVAACYTESDLCIRNAAINCGETETPCSGPSELLLAILISIGFMKLSERKKMRV